MNSGTTTYESLICKRVPHYHSVRPLSASWRYSDHAYPQWMTTPRSSRETQGNNIMKHYFLALPILAALTVPSLAAGTMVHNQSGLPIDELSAAAPGTKAWGPNLMEGLGEGSLEAGMSHEVAALPDGTYDLRVSAPDEGVLCVMSNVTVKDGTINLDEAMGKACK
jgi:hypothetical protein